MCWEPPCKPVGGRGQPQCQGVPPCPGFALLQVADERFCPDVLSTAKEMSVANFRRVPKMPVYGTAQPSSKVRGTHPGASRVTCHGLPALPSPLLSLPLDPGERPAVPDGCQEEARPHRLDQPPGRSGPGGERADLHAAGAWAPGGADPRARRLAPAAGGELLPTRGCRGFLPIQQGLISPSSPHGRCLQALIVPHPPELLVLVGFFFLLAMRGSGSYRMPCLAHALRLCWRLGTPRLM